MKDLITNELAELQKDLENLQSAAKQISQAGEASQNVIDEAQKIHNKFSENINTLTQLYEQYLQQTSDENNTKNNELINHFKETIDKQSAILDKYGETVATANANAKSLLANAEAQQQASINQLVKEAQAKLASQDGIIKKSAADSAEKIAALSKSQQVQITNTDKILNSYLELAQSTAELREKIEKIDFPERLNKINALISALTGEQQENNNSLKKIIEITSDKSTTAKVEQKASQVKTLKSLIIVLIVLTVVATAAAVLACLKVNAIN